MVTQGQLLPWVVDALKANGGRAKLVKVAKHIWDNHETELRSSGDIFYTWQYDMRWAAMRLRKLRQMQQASPSERSIWALAEPPHQSK
jgi:hypothetical protein